MNAGSSSNALTAASTASRAEPLAFSMLYPVWDAVLTPASPAFLRSGCQAPAPPCTTMTGLCIVEVASCLLCEGAVECFLRLFKFCAHVSIMVGFCVCNLVRALYLASNMGLRVHVSLLVDVGAYLSS